MELFKKPLMGYQGRRQFSNFTRIFSWFSRFAQGPPQIPSFEKCTHRDIKRESGIDPNNVYLNNLYWTPRFYQAPALSTAFERELKKFQGLDVWEDKDVLALTQLILIEATRDTTFDVSFGFRASPSPICQFHGRFDCLLYQRFGGEDIGVPDLKEAEGHNDFDRGIGFPLLPVFFPVQLKSIHSPFTQENFPLTQVVSAGLWCLEHMSDVDPSIEYVRVLHTDGHRWKLYEVHRSHVKKTKFFEPRAGLRRGRFTH